MELTCASPIPNVSESTPCPSLLSNQPPVLLDLSCPLLTPPRPDATRRWPSQTRTNPCASPSAPSATCATAPPPPVRVSRFQAFYPKAPISRVPMLTSAGSVPSLPVPAAFQTTPALSVTSATSSPSLPSPSLIEEDLREDEAEDRRRLSSATAAEGAGAQREGEEWKTLSRVQNFPLVNSALRAYEQSKASSRVVKARRLLSVLFTAVGG